MVFLLRRLGFYLIAFWACITLNFLLPRLMPGDPVPHVLPSTGSGCARTRSMPSRLFGVDDRPLWEQYIDYIRNIFRGHMGCSICVSPPLEVIASQIGWTLLLGGTALVIAAIMGNLFGILAAWRRGRVRLRLPPLIFFIGSFPYFWLAMGPCICWRGAGLVPHPPRFHRWTGARVHLEFIGDVGAHLLLPALTIVLVSIGGWMLGMRNTMIATNSRTTSPWPRPRDSVRHASCSATRHATPCCPRSRRSACPWDSSSAALCSPRRVRVPRHRLPAPDLRPGAGLPADPRHLPDHHRRRAGSELPGRHHLRTARPACPGQLETGPPCHLQTQHPPQSPRPATPPFRYLNRPAPRRLVHGGFVHGILTTRRPFSDWPSWCYLPSWRCWPLSWHRGTPPTSAPKLPGTVSATTGSEPLQRPGRARPHPVGLAKLIGRRIHRRSGGDLHRLPVGIASAYFGKPSTNCSRC